MTKVSREVLHKICSVLSVQHLTRIAKRFEGNESNSKDTAKDLTSDARRARERRRSILKYVTDFTSAGNAADAIKNCVLNSESKLKILSNRQNIFGVVRLSLTVH